MNNLQSILYKTLKNSDFTTFTEIDWMRFPDAECFHNGLTSPLIQYNMNETIIFDGNGLWRYFLQNDYWECEMISLSELQSL